jgi:hypothetical protein
MQPDLTLSTSRRSDGDRLGPSNLAGTVSRRASDDAVLALTLGERLLLSLGIQAFCLVVQAAEVLAGERHRDGYLAAARQGPRRPGQ